MIDCTPDGTLRCTSLTNFQNCLTRRTRGRNLVPTSTIICFRNILTGPVINCLRQKYPEVRKLLPLGPAPRPPRAPRAKPSTKNKGTKNKSKTKKKTNPKIKLKANKSFIDFKKILKESKKLG